MEIYDQQFNINEWFVLILIFISYLIIFLLPKRFATSTTLTFITLGIFIGMILDHTLSIPPFDLYDVNDSYIYEMFDFLTYCMYGPFSYLFLYIYDRFTFKGFQIINYIILWTILSILLEYTSTKLGVFHYKNGYRLLFSIPIYLIVQSLTLVYYYVAFKRANHDTSI